MKYMSPTSIANHNVVQDNYENIKFNSPTSLVLSVHSASLCSVPITQIMTQRNLPPSTFLFRSAPLRIILVNLSSFLYKLILNGAEQVNIILVVSKFISCKSVNLYLPFLHTCSEGGQRCWEIWRLQNRSCSPSSLLCPGRGGLQFFPNCV